MAHSQDSARGIVPVPLTARDRVAFAYRVAGAVLGLSFMVWVSVAEQWRESWALGLVGLVVVGGAAGYHLLTSVVRCPTCSTRVTNFAIGADQKDGKVFRCARCQTSACLREGFFWMDDF